MGATTYLIWGLFPLYFHALIPASATEILVHRIVWASLTCALLLTVTRSWRDLRSALRDRTLLWRLTVAAVLVAVNWLVYIIAVLTGNVVQAALGYYINPLLTVLLGVVVLHERLRRAQWLAIALAVCAVVVLTVGYGRPPWLSLLLAVTFALYGLMKNRVGGRVSALGSLTIETTVLFLPALAVLVVLQARGHATFGTHGAGHSVLLVGGGLLTTVTLLLFAGAASRIPLSLLGLLQYLTPTGQLIMGVLVLGEAMTPARWVGFALVWAALTILSADTALATRSSRVPVDDRPGEGVQGLVHRPGREYRDVVDRRLGPGLGE